MPSTRILFCVDCLRYQLGIPAPSSEIPAPQLQGSDAGSDRDCDVERCVQRKLARYRYFNSVSDSAEPQTRLHRSVSPNKATAIATLIKIIEISHGKRASRHLQGILCPVHIPIPTLYPFPSSSPSSGTSVATTANCKLQHGHVDMSNNRIDSCFTPGTFDGH